MNKLLSIKAHFQEYTSEYLMALLFYVLPLIVDVFIFRSGAFSKPETNGDLLATGTMTVVPVFNWLPIVLITLKTVGGWILQ